MSEQQQNDGRRRPQPPVLSLVRQSHDAAVAVLIERDDAKAKLAETEHELQLERRRADLAEQENVQLREQLERTTVERDGYFKDTCVLRSQVQGIGTAVAEVLRTMVDRQAFTPTPSARTTPIENDVDLPEFLHKGPRPLDETAVPQRRFDLDRFAETLKNGAADLV